LDKVPLIKKVRFTNLGNHHETSRELAGCSAPCVEQPPDAACGLLSGLEVVLPLLTGVLPIPPGIFAALSFVTVAAAFIARVIAQEDLDND
jgi:hypothetical protein